MLKNNISENSTVAAPCSKQNAAVSSRNPLSDRTNKENTLEDTKTTITSKLASLTISHNSKENKQQLHNIVNKNKEEKKEVVTIKENVEVNVKSSQQLIKLYERGNKKLVLQTVESLEQKLRSLQTQLSNSTSSPSSPSRTTLTTASAHITSELTVLNDFLSSIPPHDIDSCDQSDAQALVDYLVPIYSYLLEKEQQSLLSRGFLSRQHDITEKMRGILVDWLVEVHRMFKLLPETLFLSVYIIDKYLSLEKVERDKLQLIGITSMLIASKYEEIYAPECNDFVYVSDGTYTKKQILDMEGKILNALSFKLTTPLSLQFLRRYSKVASSDYNVHSLCKYIIEIALLHADIHTYPPSIIAASAVYIARKMTGETSLWNPTLEHYTSYSETEVIEASRYVNTTLKTTKGSTTLRAIEKKYSMVKFGQVTNIPLVDLE